MLAHAASSSALPWPLVSRPMSRQSRLETLVFPRKTGGFAAEGVGFELVGFESQWKSLPEQRCRECSRRPSIQDALAETAYHSIQ